MYGSVLSVLNNHQATWQAVPAFADTKETFEIKLNLLRARVAEQLGVVTGISAEKKLRTADLRSRMLLVHNALFLYARVTDNVLLRERNDLHRTDLLKMNLNEFAAHCSQLRNDLEIAGASLETYGITQQALDELLPLLQGINELNNSMRQAVIKRKGITQAISDLENELDELLRVELDRLILLYRQTAPSFVQDYESARITIHYGSSKGHKPDNPELVS